MGAVKILLCGPSGSGKTFVGEFLANDYKQRGFGKIFVVDGDDLRSTLNEDLGFSDDDILENARRIVGLSKWLERRCNAKIIITQIIAPTIACREFFKKNNFIVLKINRKDCFEEDLKGLYSSKKAREWEEDDNNKTIDAVINNSKTKNGTNRVYSALISEIKHIIDPIIISENNPVKPSLYIVRAKCGHVGIEYYTIKEFAVKSLNGKEAAAKVRQMPRVKHDDPNAILSVRQVSQFEFDKKLKENNQDPYLKAINIQEQRENCQNLKILPNINSNNVEQAVETLKKPLFSGKERIKNPKKRIQDLENEDSWSIVEDYFYEED